MVRKIVVAAVLVVAGLVLVNLAGLSSYPSTAFKNIRSNMKKQVPLEFEIERVRNEVAQLVPDMKRNCTLIAEEMVAIENLKEEVATIKTNVKSQETALRTASKELESGATRIVYRNREFKPAQLGEQLTRDFATFKRCQSELRSKEQLLGAKERSLDVAREQLASMKSQKQELEVQVAQLEAELKTVRLSQTKSKFNLDDSQLSKCKATLAEIQNRLDVEKKTNELYDAYGTDTLTGEKPTRSAKEVAKEINAHFENPREEKIAADQDQK